MSREPEVEQCRKEGCKVVPTLIGPSGWCRSHDPDLAEERRAQGKKGGAAARAKLHRGRLDPDDLPPLDSPKAAAEWCSVIGLATASGHLPASRAQALMRIVSQWQKAHDAGQTADRIDELRRELQALKRNRK